MIHLEQTHEWVLLRPRSSLHNERRYNWLSTHKFELSFLPFPFLSFEAMLNDCSHRLMRCWSTVPMVCCNVERSFLSLVILFLSFQAMLNDRSHRLMRCWTTVPMVWSYVERPFLSFVMLFLSFDAITNVSRKKHWHTGYIITIDPPLCVVSTCTKPKSCNHKSRAKKNWHYLLAEGGVLCHNFCRWWPTSWTTGILIRILRRPTRLVRWNSAYLWK